MSRRLPLLGIVAAMVGLFVVAGGPGALAGRDDDARCRSERGCPVVVTTRTTITLGGMTSTTTETAPATTTTVATVTETSTDTTTVPTTETSTEIVETTTTVIRAEGTTITRTVTETAPATTTTTTVWDFVDTVYPCGSCGA